MRFFTATLFLALAATASAQQVIEGTVLNATTGTPVSRAQVAFRRINPNGFPNPQAPGFAADTNSQGKFELAHIEPGSYSVAVQRTGFVTQQYKGQITVNPGGQIRSLDFKLIPHAVVTGRVIAEDGTPLAGMELQILRPQSINGKQQLLRVGAAQSSDTGEFRIVNLPAGRYLLSATNQNSYQAFLSNSLRYDFDKPQFGFTKTFFPSTTDEAEARQLDLNSGQTLSGLELRMKQERAFRIRGKVSSATPVKDIRVIITARSTDPFIPATETREAILNPDGTFEISRVFPGAYNVVATMATGTRSTIGKTPIDVTVENVNNVIVNKIEAFTVSGTIRIEGPPTATPPSLASVRIFLTAATPIPSDFRQANPDSQGNFRLENVTSEKLRLRLQDIPDGLWLKAATAAGRDILNSEMDAKAAPVEIILATGVGDITGTITTASGQPVSGSRIFLAPDPSQTTRPDLFRNATSDQNGRFNIPNLAPGSYNINAVPPFDPLTPPPPSARSKPQQLVIRPNTQQQMALTLN
jgi:hypothetical protein